MPPAVFAQFKQGFENAQAQGQSKNGNQTFASLGIDPSKWLKDAKDEDDEDVEGTSTNHVSATVRRAQAARRRQPDPGKAGQLGATSGRADPQPAHRRSSARRSRTRSRTRRSTSTRARTTRCCAASRSTVEFKVPQSQQANRQGLTGGTVTFDLTLGDLNQPQTIAAPGERRSPSTS